MDNKQNAGFKQSACTFPHGDLDERSHAYVGLVQKLQPAPC